MNTIDHHTDDEELQRLYIPLEYLGVPKTPTFWQRVWLRVRYGIRFRKLKVPHVGPIDLRGLPTVQEPPGVLEPVQDR